MRTRALAGGVVVLVVGGGALGWMASRWQTPGRGLDDVAAEVETLRVEAKEQGEKIHRLEISPTGVGDVSRLARELEEQAARIARLEARAATSRGVGVDDENSAEVDLAARKRNVLSALDGLKAITDGRKTVAIQDGFKSLVRMGDAAVPDIVEALKSGFDRAYGGRLYMNGNAVESYPTLRLVLMDALRQIGTATAQAGLIDVLTVTARITDSPVVWMYWDGGFKDPADPAITKALSSMTTSLLMQLSATGLDGAGCDVSNGPCSAILWWVLRHPMPEDAPALEQLIRRGRPKEASASTMFNKFFSVFVQVAPQDAAKAAPDAFPGYGLVSLAEQLGEVSKASQAQYYAALFAQGGMDVNVRVELYNHMAFPDDRIKDPAQRVTDVQPVLRFLESQVNEESDAVAKSGAEKALKQLQDAIEQTRRQH